MSKQLNLNGNTSSKPMQRLPEFDAALLFTKPALVCAGLIFEEEGITIYHTLDGDIRCVSVDDRGYGSPRDAMLYLLEQCGIDCGKESDGLMYNGRIIDLTEPSHAVQLTDHLSDVKIKGEKVIVEYCDIFNLTREHYPDNMWPYQATGAN